MKTFNTKFVVALITTLLLTGCMPDSLTKFKKEDVKKAASTETDTTTPPITDSSGNAVDPDTLVFPTKFFYKNEGIAAEDALQVGSAYSVGTTTDGTLADPETRSLIFLKCELVTTGAVITRTLPPGLSLNQSTCVISGTPLSVYSDTTVGNVGGLIEYTVRMVYKGANYTGAGTESSLLTTIKLAAYDTPDAVVLSQNDKLQVKLILKSGVVSNIQTNTDSTLSYNRYGILTSSKNISGVVKYVDTSTNTIGVYRAQPVVVNSVVPFSVNGFVSTSGNAKRGKIISINSTTRTLYLEALTANTVFAVGDALDNATSFLAAESTVTAVDSTYKFAKDGKVDNDTQYYSEKFNIESITQTYERGVAITPISPSITSKLQPANGIIWSISPALPDGLSFSTTTGTISGTFTNTLDSTVFTVSAYNDIGETSAEVRLAAINSPQNLSYTTNQLISVASNALFLEGETLFQPKAAPLDYYVKAKILRKVSTNKLSIQNNNGYFLPEASLDSGNAYYSEKNYIPTSAENIYYNVVLTVASTASFSSGTIISSSTGAKGRVVYVDASNSNLYVQFLTPSIVSSIPAGTAVTSFAQSTTVDNVYPFVSAKTTITQVEANTMALTLTNATGFTQGSDLTTNSGHAGYIYSQDTINSIIGVNDIDREGSVGSNYFRIGQNIDVGEYYSAATAQISGVSHDSLIVLERGEVKVLKANISQGTSVIYSISPTLPTGLSFNSLTGDITGTPTAVSSRKSYVVTATNLLNKAYYTFDLEIRDYFSFKDESGAESFLSHKIGANRSARACRINSNDIINGRSSALDIGCYLEAEELELYYNKLKIGASVGAGACTYIGFKPFSFYMYAPVKTPAATSIDVVSNSCTGGPGGASTSYPTSADVCLGNYTNDGGPNCDEGSVTVNTYTAANAGDACLTPTVTTLNCGGKKINCLAGPITSVVTSTTELEKGVRLSTITSSTGASKTWELKSPFDFIDITNRRNSNNFAYNGCDDSRADAVILAARVSANTALYEAGESKFYEFTCLDAAKDVKARMRLVVRDWDRTFKINDSLTSIAPTKMNTDIATDPVFGTPYNNIEDWDDHGPASSYSGACGTGTYSYPQEDI